jgi:hypothetical protein
VPVAVMSFFARHKAAVATAARAVDGFKQEWVRAQAVSSWDLPRIHHVI